MPSNHLILCRSLLLPPSIFPSIRVFSNESTLCIRWPNYWSFSFNISPSNEYSELISFRVDWLDLLAVHRHSRFFFTALYSLKASILQHSAFFIMVQLSYPCMTTGKTIALTIYTFVGKVTSLFFNTLSGFVTAFLTRSKHLLISWLQSLYTVILEPKKKKSVTVFIVFPSICHEVMGPDAFELWCWRRLLRVPWTARRSNQSILKEVGPGCSLEGLMLKLNSNTMANLIRRADSLEKTLMLGKIEGRIRRG